MLYILYRVLVYHSIVYYCKHSCSFNLLLTLCYYMSRAGLSESPDPRTLSLAASTKIRGMKRNKFADLYSGIEIQKRK